MSRRARTASPTHGAALPASSSWERRPTTTATLPPRATARGATGTAAPCSSPTTGRLQSRSQASRSTLPLPQSGPAGHPQLRGAAEADNLRPLVRTAILLRQPVGPRVRRRPNHSPRREDRPSSQGPALTARTSAPQATIPASPTERDVRLRHERRQLPERMHGHDGHGVRPPDHLLRHRVRSHDVRRRGATS